MTSAHDVGERVIPVGEAWELASWYLQPSPRPRVRIRWTCREEVIARAVVGGLLLALYLLAATVI